MLEVESSTFVRAPWEEVAAIYADYRSWPDLFPTIDAVRLVKEEPDRVVLEVSHLEGLVPNVLTFLAPGEIRLDERKRRFDGTFVNRFEPVAGGTRYRVTAHIRLKPLYRPLAPLLRGYVRRQIERLVLAPVKERAERAAP